MLGGGGVEGSGGTKGMQAAAVPPPAAPGPNGRSTLGFERGRVSAGTPPSCPETSESPERSIPSVKVQDLLMGTKAQVVVAL